MSSASKQRYLRYKKLPSRLRRAIIDYYIFLSGGIQALDENSVLVDLPPALQLQMDVVCTRSIFTNIPLFRFFPASTILAMVLCAPSPSPLLFAPR